MRQAKLPRFAGTVAFVALALVPSPGGADVGTASRMAPAPLRAPVQPTPAISPSLIARGKGRMIRLGGRPVPADEYLAKTPRDTPITLRSGNVTTLGALLGSYAKLEAALKQRGSSFDKIANPNKAGSDPHLGLVALAPPLVTTVTPTSGDPDRGQTITREERQGTRSIYPFSSFTAKGTDPATADSSECSVSWDAGLQFYKERVGIVHVDGGERVTSAGPQAWLTIKVLGKAEFVGSLGADGDGAPPFEKAISTSQLPNGEPTEDFSMLGDVIKVHAVGGGSAYVKLATSGETGSVQLAGANNGFYCRTRVNPQLRTEVHARAEADIGDLNGFPALKILGHGSLVPIQLDFPTTVTLAIQKSPLKIGFGFKSNLTIQLMNGKIQFHWEYPDKCVADFCLVHDGLGIPNTGEIKAPWSYDLSSPLVVTKVADQEEPPLAAGETLVPR